MLSLAVLIHSILRVCLQEAAWERSLHLMALRELFLEFGCFLHLFHDRLELVACLVLWYRVLKALAISYGGRGTGIGSEALDVGILFRLFSLCLRVTLI